MAMNLRLSDEQTEALRARADAEGRSMQQLALAAIDEYLLRVVDDERTDALAAEGAARYRAVLDRLGEQVVRHLTTEQALGIARHAVGPGVQVRDLGSLDAATHRPQASMFGVPVYADLFSMAAALLHGLVTSHPLVDGNKRLGWLATWVFLAKNDVRVEADDDVIHELVIDVASGAERDVATIAARLRAFRQT